MAGPDRGEERKKPSQWKGKSASSLPKANYGWKVDHNSDQVRLTRRRNRLRRLSVISLLLLVGLGSAIFLATVLQRELQPPFVAIVKTAYSHDFPPNSWSFEDLDALRNGVDSLDHKTLGVIDLSDVHHANENLLTVPDERERKRVVMNAERTGVIIFYISMHGMVDDNDEACVATTESNPLDAKTWLPVSGLLSQIQNWKLPDHVHKLLILDCNRQDANWKIGLLKNDFADRLLIALQKNRVPNLVILNSTSGGQVGHSSAEMRGSVFGQYLRLGLAGAADLPDEGGNHDRRVSLKELENYLTKHVDAWSRKNRGVSQQPMLIPSDVSDFRLTCSLDRSRLDRLLTKFKSGSAAEATVSRDNLNKLWTSYSDLRNSHADSVAPLEMGKLRRQLVWLEQASQAGSAYRGFANKAEDQLRKLSSVLDEKVNPKDVVGREPLRVADYSDIRVAGLAARLHSVYLLARMGQLNSDVIDDILVKSSEIEVEGTWDKLEAMLEVSPNQTSINSLGIVHFLKLMRRYESLRGTPAAAGSLVPALQLQLEADSAAVPSDPRAQSWIQEVIKAADVARRRSEDSLFNTGNADPISIDAAKSGYHEATSIANEVQKAWQLSDLVSSELPDLADWLVKADSIRHESEEVCLKTKNEIINLISANDQLVKRLNSQTETEKINRSENLFFTPQYDAVKAQYEVLRERFNDACQRLVASSEFTADLMPHAAAVLSSPLLSSHKFEDGQSSVKQREQIKSGFLKACEDLHRRSFGQQTSADVSAQLKSTKPHIQDVQTPATSDSESGKLSIESEPLLSIVELIASASSNETDGVRLFGSDETLAGAGKKVREILLSIPDKIKEARRRHVSSPDQVRRELCVGAQLARSWAPFNVKSVSLIDPVVDLRRADVLQILLGQSQRYLDDFWGPSRTNERSFFDAAAKDTLDAARRISDADPAIDNTDPAIANGPTRNTIANAAILNQMSEIQSLLEVRLKASRDGLTVHADAPLPFELVDHPVASVAVTRTGDGLPTGIGMLRVADQNGALLEPVVDFSLKATETPGASELRQLQWTPESTRQESTGATGGTVSAYFRGHEFRDDLVIRAAAGSMVESRPFQSHHARVRLNGDKRKRVSVVFVLDCSASMQKGMPFESSARIVPRMDIAKNALIRMLNTLATRSDARVGVLLYGHRVGWSTKEPNQLMSQPAFGAVIPESLKPYEDVETILPLGRFDAAVSNRVAQQLEKVKPWGETPLYLSLIQALFEFKNDDEDSQQSVVVITDGVNYQFNPRPEMAKSIQDVLNAEGSRRIPLHIVGFGIQANEAPEAQREFSQLARATGGQYVPVSEAAMLAETLEGILQRQPYATVSPTGFTSKADIGTSIDLNWESDARQNYGVTFDSVYQEIELTGGEAVELFLSQDGRSMLSAPYNMGAPTFSSLVGGSQQDPAGVRLGVHTPVYEGTTVTFDLSLQDEQQRFVSRPREVWIEITPISNSSRQSSFQKYIFYDPEFVPNKPVPVIRAQAVGWPKEASRARIEFWCKWTSTEPNLKIAFSEIPDPGLTTKPDQTLDGIPDLKYQVKRRQGAPTRVDFIETYSSKVGGGTMLKVDILGTFPPSETRHQFDEANRFSTHSFVFVNVSENLLNSSNSIRIVSRRRMMDNALHPDVPLLIDVRAQPDTLTTSP